VTLGRALVELGQLEEARAEFAVVLRAAPGNLAAIRGMADLCERLGLVEEALSFYKSALSIAHNDPELEESVGDLSRRLVMRPGPAVSETSETSEPLPPEPPPMVLFEPMDPERAHAERTIAALELWLDAIHGTRAY
jgi:tetratricopeptide (TPR) repeat protein